MHSHDVWTRLLELGDASGDAFDDDEAARLVQVLCQRGEPVVLEWALPVLTNPDPWRRQAAARVLGELGYERGRPFADRVMPALVSAARAEQDDDSRESMVAAIGHADDPAWLPELLRYVDDHHARVRECVAGALPHMFRGADLSADAVAALITLTRDADPGVRDWATFSLGNQGFADSDAIRDALAARLDDDGGDTRFEAAVGLARRGDRRGLAEVARRLDDDTATIYLLDLVYAAELADPVLLPALARLRMKWAGDDDRHTVALAYAIDRCQRANHDLATTCEVEFVSAVNDSLLDIGWTIASSGTYPQTILTVRRPDGSLGANRDRTPLWNGISPANFNLAQEVASWSGTIRTMAPSNEKRERFTRWYATGFLILCGLYASIVGAVHL